MVKKRKLYFAEKFFIKEKILTGTAVNGCGEKACWYLATKV
jgi:hypothetical protein